MEAARTQEATPSAAQPGGELLKQIDGIIRQAGQEVDEKSRQNAQWLLEKGLPVTAQNLKPSMGAVSIAKPLLSSLTLTSAVMRSRISSSCRLAVISSEPETSPGASVPGTARDGRAFRGGGSGGGGRGKEPPARFSVRGDCPPGLPLLRRRLPVLFLWQARTPDHGLPPGLLL